MVQATEFFSRPAGTDMCRVYSQVLNIFVDNFKTYAILSLLQALAFLPVIFIVVRVAALAVASEAAILFQAMNNGYRRLYETTTGSSWDSSTDYDTTSYGANDDFDTLPPGFLGFIMSLLGLYVFFLAATICISSIFQGAFVRATGEVFAGRSPNWQACLQIGWKKVCSIICFGLLILAVVFGGGVLWFAITFVPAIKNMKFGIAFLSLLVFFVACIIFACSMTAGVTSIMVEDKTAFAAVRRSWNLCKSNKCFIFCCVFCFYFMEAVGQNLVKRIILVIFSVGQNDLTSAMNVYGAAAWVMGLLLGPLNATLKAVIYFSLRISNEGLTMEQLQNELSLAEDSVELRTGDGIYSKVQNDKDTSLVPIAQATAV